MNPTGGGATPWKARWAIVLLAVAAVIAAPDMVGQMGHRLLHGTGVVGCHLVDNACAIDPEHPTLPVVLPSPQNGPPATWINQRNGD